MNNIEIEEDIGGMPPSTDKEREKLVLAAAARLTKSRDDSRKWLENLKCLDCGIKIGILDYKNQGEYCFSCYYDNNFRED